MGISEKSQPKRLDKKPGLNRNPLPIIAIIKIYFCVLHDKVHL